MPRKANTSSGLRQSRVRSRDSGVIMAELQDALGEAGIRGALKTRITRLTGEITNYITATQRQLYRRIREIDTLKGSAPAASTARGKRTAGAGATRPKAATAAGGAARGRAAGSKASRRGKAADEAPARSRRGSSAAAGTTRRRTVTAPDETPSRPRKPRQSRKVSGESTRQAPGVELNMAEMPTFPIPVYPGS